MKQIGEPETVVANDAWGRSVRVIRTIYEVEESDAGKFREHYLGFFHRRVQIERKHVGKTIIVYTDGTGWTCWAFN